MVVLVFGFLIRSLSSGCNTSHYSTATVVSSRSSDSELAKEPFLPVSGNDALHTWRSWNFDALNSKFECNK